MNAAAARTTIGPAANNSRELLMPVYPYRGGISTPKLNWTVALPLAFTSM